MPEIEGGLAVADPEVSTGGGESVDTGVDSGAEAEVSSEVSSEVDSSTENEALTAKSGAKGKLNLADVVKTQGDALKAINPALPAAIRTAAFEQASLYREFPGGLKEAVAQKTALSELGGLEGIKETAQTASEMGEFARSFLEGKPEFIASLIKESPASFAQMMPESLPQWKAIDKDGYDHSLAKVMTQTLDASNVQPALVALYNATEKPELKAEIERIWNLLEGYRKVGEKAPEKKVDPKNEALTKKEQELAAREEKLFMAPISSEGKQQIASITDREMAQGYQWDKTDPDVKTAVQERVRLEVVSASKKDKGFCAEYDRLKARGDAAGLTRHVKNFQDRVVPGVVTRVAKLFAVKPKNAGAAPVKKPVTAINGNGNGATASKDWVRVSVQPKFSDFDRTAMGRDFEDMILSHKGVLKGGKRVMWG